MYDFTVLGTLGPAGSGKDVVGDWFAGNGFTKIAFADPMKRFAMKTFDLSVQQLWGPTEERNKEFDIDLNWWYQSFACFGKASEEIVRDVLLDGDRATGYLKLHEWLSDLRKRYPTRISTRVILQTLGTEWGRSVDPLMWARYCYQTINWFKEAFFHQYTQEFGRTTKVVRGNKDGVIITDHRFINEVQYTQEHGGYVMRLRRLALEKKNETVGIAGHQSEAEQKTIPDSYFDLVLEFEEGLDKVYEKLSRTYKEKLWTLKRQLEVPTPS